MNRDVCDKTNTYGKWFVGTIVSVMVLTVCVILLNITVDPFFHYHAPVTRYRLNDERYINDGIARHFDYDAVIIGNSLFQNFKTSQYDELFDVNSVKLPYSGAGIMELWQAIGRIVGRGETDVDIVAYDHKHGTEYISDYKPRAGYRDDVKEFIVCMDIEDTMRGYSWHRYNDYPTYLYDDDILNDTEYILNKDIFYRGTLYNTGMTLLGRDSTTFDDYSSWTRESGAKQACMGLSRIEDSDDRDLRQLSEGDRESIYVNIATNMLPVINAADNTSFRLLIPPVSIAKWAEYYNKGEVEYVLDGYEYILSILTACDNVTIYGFDNVSELTTDLDRYCDTIHYDAGINEWMLNEIAKGRHIIDAGNYTDYIGYLREYYGEYDYTGLNQYIEQE